MRKIFKIIDKKEIEIKMSELNKGDKFKVYYDNELFIDDGGKGIFIAASNSFINDKGIEVINIY